MRHIWSAAALLLLTACAPPAQRITPLDHLPVLKGDYFPIRSREAGHLYHIYIRTPEGYAENPGLRYPVVYLLDGGLAVSAARRQPRIPALRRQAARSADRRHCHGSFEPPQSRRRHDFTVGADAFGRFLRHELIPAAERRVRAEPSRRIMFGQSRGGGFVLHSAFTDPDLFWARVASNPTLDLLPALLRPPARAARSDLRLLVASGSRDPDLRDPALRWFEQWAPRKDLRPGRCAPRRSKAARMRRTLRASTSWR